MENLTLCAVSGELMSVLNLKFRISCEGMSIDASEVWSC